jgi:hypothetical protein
MALPIQPTNTQAGCNPVSSNCVIWQGPDIPCIDLCKGDSISDVTFKIATELCTLVDQLDIQYFDVSCFPPICPKPENIHELIQFILDKLCELDAAVIEANTNAKSKDGSLCPDNCIVSIAPCFYYPNQFGQQVTTMTLTEYATAIGIKVCNLIDWQIAADITFTQIDARLDAIEACDPCNPPAPVIEIPTSCLSPSTNIPIVTFVETMEAELCELKTAVVGDSVASQVVVDGVLSRQCEGLESATPLSQPFGSMGLIPGWVTAASGNFTTLSAAVQNLWLTVCDMRSALANVVTNCCNECNQVVLSLANSSYDPATTILTIDFAGSIPAGITCSGNLSIQIMDCNGVNFVYNTGATLCSLMGSSTTVTFSVSAPGTFNTTCVGSNAYRILITGGNANLETTATGAKCDLTFIEYVAGNAVPALTITPISTTQLRATFTPVFIGPVTYYLELWDNSFTGIVASAPIVTPATAVAFNYTFGSLTTLTTYQTRIVMVAGASSETGSFVPGTTL